MRLLFSVPCMLSAVILRVLMGACSFFSLVIRSLWGRMICCAMQRAGVPPMVGGLKIPIAHCKDLVTHIVLPALRAQNFPMCTFSHFSFSSS